MKILNKQDYSKLSDRVKQLPFNSLFARAVVEKMITGSIYVDNPLEIKTAYITHPYGMTLLLGDTNQEDFNQQFKTHALNTENKRSSFEWMQSHPSDWENKLNEIFGELLIKPGKNDLQQEKGIIEQNARINFKFDKAAYLTKKVEKYNPNIKIVPTTRQLFREMKGTVIPKYFWNSEDDFFESGMAYSLIYNGELASMAFAACKIGDQLELGIETLPEYRGMRLAEIVCSSLIDYCIENNYEPVWACRKENRGSYKLALKLGFHPALELPYYRLSK